MQIICENGYYKFYPESSHEIDLLSGLGFSVIAHKDFFTFPALAALPGFSIEALPFGGIAAITTFAGRVEDVLLKNAFVYDLESGVILQKEAINTTVKSYENDKIVFDGIPQAGGMIGNKQLRGFNANFDIMGSGIIYANEVQYYV